ncbi:MAG: hypothetical protein ABI664_12925 [bacterium]
MGTTRGIRALAAFSTLANAPSTQDALRRLRPQYMHGSVAFIRAASSK